MKAIRSRLAAVAVGSLAAVAAVATPAGAAAPAPSPESIIPGCAWGSDWGAVQNTETELLNPALDVGEPDSDANYWSLAYTYEPGETITLNGVFPDSRFQSFQIYGGGGTFLTNSTLTDYEIAPDQGSVNPFQPASDPWPPIARHRGGRAGEHYTVMVTSDPQPGEANTLPIAPPGEEPGKINDLTIRDYLQTGGIWAVPAPSVTFSYDGVTKLVAPCSREQETFPGLTSSNASAASAQSTAFKESSARTDSGSPGEISVPFFATTSGLGANGDTQYLEAEVRPPSNGEVLLVKGKEPTATPGTHPHPWPSPGIDLRYWALCDYLGEATVHNQLPDGQVDWGCRNNDQTRVSRDGDYTFAVGTEAQRAAIERIPDVTFLPFSEANAAGTTGLLVRNQLASPSFANVIATWPTAATLTPAEAATADEQAMGAYYPKLSWSTIPALEHSARRGY